MPPTQLLLPQTHVDPLDRLIPLAALPPDEVLVGDPPDKALVASIRALGGVLQPVLVIARAGGTYGVAAGKRRIKAARAAGLEQIAARIFPEGWISVHSIALMENALRGPNLVSDYEAIAALRAAGADEKAICAATGLSVQEVRARRRLEALIPPLHAALRCGALRATVAYEAARLGADQQDALAAQLAATGTLSSADVRAARTVQRVTAFAALPAALFATPEAVPAEPWPAEVGRLLAQAQALVPAEASALRAAIGAALRALDAVASAPTT